MFIEFLQVFLPIIIYILLIILLIVVIILGIKAIKIIDKAEKIAESLNDKIESLNGLFSLIDFTTEKIASITDMFVNGVSGLIGKLFKGKNKIKKEEE